MHLNCRKLNELRTESIKFQVYVANKLLLFFTFLHLKSKKKNEWWKVRYWWKTTEQLTFAEIILAPSKCIELVFFIRK